MLLKQKMTRRIHRAARCQENPSHFNLIKKSQDPSTVRHLGLLLCCSSIPLLLAAALLELVAGTTVTLGIPRHGRNAKARRRLAGQRPRHAPHELGGLALESTVTDGVTAAGDGHDDHEGIG